MSNALLRVRLAFETREAHTSPQRFLGAKCISDVFWADESRHFETRLAKVTRVLRLVLNYKRV
jgi:hypothetical protein